MAADPPRPARSLAGRAVLIAGAGDGIGRSCALALATDGADLVLGARTAERLASIAAEVRATTGRRVVTRATDLTDAAQVAALVHDGAAELGRLDGVVHVAARSGPRQRIEDREPDELRRSFEVNVVAALEVCRRAIPHLRAAGGGAIVQVSTLSAHTHLPGLADYTSTKAALESASLTLAREVGRDGIRVNVVVPGYTTGEGLDAHLDGVAAHRGTTRDEVRAEIEREAALRTIATPDDIAEAVLYLVSGRSRTVTGQLLHVNAGAWIA